MPPFKKQKEIKEAVVYPGSKRKQTAFKPQRPAKLPRSSAMDESGSSSGVAPISRQAAIRQKAILVENASDHEVDNEEEPERAMRVEARRSDLPEDDSESSGEELDENPLAPKARSKPSTIRPAAAAPARRKPARATPREPSPMSVSDASPPPSDPPIPSQPSAGDIPTIPQPLLTRLLHEHFTDKGTKIDKHALQVVQKYMEVFVREAIARTAVRKADGAGKELDRRWLELEDLEGIAAGMMLDF